MSQTQIDLRDRVKRGAELLDRERPGWAAEVDVERMDLGSCVDCVLGQLYGLYSDGLRAIGIIGRPLDHLGVAEGFTSGAMESRKLTTLWRAEIESRLKGASLSAS